MIKRSPNNTPVIRLRLDRWLAVCDRHGLTTDAQKADALGTTREYVSSVQNGRRNPGVPFIASALLIFRVRFEHLFEVGAE